MPHLTFHLMTEADWPDVQRIYAEGIATGIATFEATPPETFADFIKTKIADLAVVARDAKGALAAWAVLIPVSGRYVYRGVAEMSLYVAASHRGQRVGDAVMKEMVRLSEARGFWTLQSSTFPQNAASVALQQRHGFHIIGIREKIGRMAQGPLAGQWCDTLLLERRSKTVGRD
ncbi:MAG: N-acetyltransferase [Candidatus Didemnitutus sp.]|nr:N-acetyltransferase [Candidatus Didemnitutus sp.]